MKEALVLLAFVLGFTTVFAGVVSWIEYLGTLALAEWSFLSGPTVLWGRPKIRSSLSWLESNTRIDAPHTKARVGQANRLFFRAKFSLLSIAPPMGLKGLLEWDDDGAWVSARLPLYTSVSLLAFLFCIADMWFIGAFWGSQSAAESRFFILMIGVLFLVVSASWMLERWRFQRSVKELKEYLERPQTPGAIQ